MSDLYSFVNNTLVIISIVVVAFGCNVEGEKEVVRRIDKEKGVGNFVVGDSLYPSFRRQVIRSEGTVEYSILGNVITPYRQIESPQRFLFGLEVDEVSAKSNGGRVSVIRVGLGSLREQQLHTISDSLSARYGEPSAVMDTALSDRVKLRVRRWRGRRVWLQEEIWGNEADTTEEQTRLVLRVLNHRVLKETQQLKQQVDSLLRAGRGAGSIEKIGDFPLLSTRDHPMIKTENREYSWSDSTITVHTLSYDHLESFFGLENPLRPSRDERVISAEVNFEEESDSLSSLTVSIYGEKYDPGGRGTLDRSAYEGASEVASILEKRLGNPDLEIEESRVPIGEDEIRENRLRYWYRPPILVEEAPSDLLGGVYEEGKRLTFSRVDRGSPLEALQRPIWPLDFLHYRFN